MFDFIIEEFREQKNKINIYKSNKKIDKEAQSISNK
jgi:hypothetical protein